MSLTAPVSAAADAAPAAPADFDPAALALLPMVADGSDPGFATRLLAAFDANCDTDLAEVEAALARGDLVALRRTVHSLKSMAAQVGAMALSAEAAAQEAALRAGRPADAAWPQRLRQRMAGYRAAAAGVDFTRLRRPGR